MMEAMAQHTTTEVPTAAKKWNWGAFFLGWIWGIGNNVWIALLTFVPLVNVIMMFVLGAKGSQWAWEKKQWDSVEHFQRVQRIWAIVGLIVFFIGVIFGIILPLLIAILFSADPATMEGSI